MLDAIKKALQNPKVLGGALCVLGPACGGMLLAGKASVEAGSADHTSLVGAVIIMGTLVVGGTMTLFGGKGGAQPPAS